MTDNAPPGASDETPYARLGGAVRGRALVDRFYVLMELEPEYADLRRANSNDLTQARDKLNWFLTGWRGGPDEYVERFGHPRLRARHLPFSIGVRERDQWMACMNQAMIEEGVDEDLRVRLVQAYFKTADWLVNRDSFVEKPSRS